MTYNIYYKNSNFDGIFANILSSDADIIVLQEAKEPFLHEKHAQISKIYPFSYPDITKDAFFSPAIYSRYPITDVKKPLMPVSGMRTLQVVLDVDGKALDVFGIHAISPQNARAIARRNMFFQDLANYAQSLRAENRPFIMAGDFNSVPWHPKMRALQDQGGLQGNPSIMNYFGTWPAWRVPILSVPIDHIFFSEKLFVSSYQKVSDAEGSDHFPVTAEFYFCE